MFIRTYVLCIVPKPFECHGKAFKKKNDFWNFAHERRPACSFLQVALSADVEEAGVL